MSTSPIELSRCSKWYGHVLGVSEVDLKVRGGIVGLLGPNGAGKSTLMKMLVGLMRPSQGSLRVFGADPHASPSVRSRIGYCPEYEDSYDRLTAMEFVTMMARLSGLGSDAEARAHDTLVEMGLSKALHRMIGGFSKGMRQRTKLAQCLVHDPDLVILDEPLTGVDPIARAEISEKVQKLGEAGKTVVISSHVLYEIEALTSDIVVIYRGQVLAEGNLYEIRELIDRHPHRIRIECSDPRALAQGLASTDHIQQLHFERGAVVALTSEPDHCYDLIGELVVDQGQTVRSLTSPDNNLQAVFDYLTGGAS